MIYLSGAGLSRLSRTKRPLNVSVVVVCVEIGDIAGVAEVTIKHSYRLMLPRAHDLFPAEFQFATPLDQLPAS